MRGDRKRRGEERVGEGEGERVVKRMKEIERKMERKERKDKRKNVIIKGLEVREEERTKAVEGILKVIGVKVEVEKIRKLREDEGSRETVWVKVRNEE